MDAVQPVAGPTSAAPAPVARDTAVPATRATGSPDRVTLSSEVEEEDGRPLTPRELFGLHTLQAYPENGGPTLERQQLLATGGRQMTEAAALSGMRADDPQGRVRREQLMQTLEWAARNDLEVNVRLDDDWGRNVPSDEAGREAYAEQVHAFVVEADARMQAAGGRPVRTWIIGNEPNLPHENGGQVLPPGRYVAAVRAVRERLDQDPRTRGTRLASAGLSPNADAPGYFEAMQQAGIGRYVDVYGIHAYADDLGGLASTDDIARKYGAARPFLVSEFGIPRVGGMTEQEQARQVTDFVKRAAAWNADPRRSTIEGVSLWKANRGPGEEAYLLAPTLLDAIRAMNAGDGAAPAHAPASARAPGSRPSRSAEGRAASTSPGASPPGSAVSTSPGASSPGSAVSTSPGASSARPAGSTWAAPEASTATHRPGHAADVDGWADFLAHLFEWLLALLFGGAAGPSSETPPSVAGGASRMGAVGGDGNAPSNLAPGASDSGPSSGGGTGPNPHATVPSAPPSAGGTRANPYATVPSAPLPAADPNRPFQVSYIRPNTDPGLPDNPPGIEGYVTDEKGNPIDVSGWTIRFDGGAEPYYIPIVSKAERGPGYWEVPLVVPGGFSGRYNVALGRMEGGTFVPQSNTANVEVTRNHRRTQVDFSQSGDEGEVDRPTPLESSTAPSAPPSE